MAYVAFSASNKSIQFYSYVDDSGMSWVIWIKSMCAICHFGVSVGADNSRARAAHPPYPVLPKRLPFCGEHPIGIMPRQPHGGKWWHIERFGEMKPQRRIMGAIRHD